MTDKKVAAKVTAAPVPTPTPAPSNVRTETDLTALPADDKVTPPIIQTGAVKAPLIGEPDDNFDADD